ncbi:hypothetical protein C8F01DRAFT_1261825 [Mycena amicta]|nr:hypothetical protein C8F01DRAFT_1261825 [Mycena amicta]
MRHVIKPTERLLSVLWRGTGLSRSVFGVFVEALLPNPDRLANSIPLPAHLHVSARAVRPRISPSRTHTLRRPSSFVNIVDVGQSTGLLPPLPAASPFSTVDPGEQLCAGLFVRCGVAGGGLYWEGGGGELDPTREIHLRRFADELICLGIVCFTLGSAMTVRHLYGLRWGSVPSHRPRRCRSPAPSSSLPKGSLLPNGEAVDLPPRAVVKSEMQDECSVDRPVSAWASRSTIHSSRPVDGGCDGGTMGRERRVLATSPVLTPSPEGYLPLPLPTCPSPLHIHRRPPVLRDAAFLDRLRLRRRRRPSTFKRQRHLRLRDLGDACDVRYEDTST